MSDMGAHLTPAPALYLERQSVRQYVVTNSRGAQVLVGDGPRRFSSDGLSKIALASCNATSSDKRLADWFGKDFEQAAGISGEYLSDEDRFASFVIELIRDLSGVDEEGHTKLLRRMKGAIERNYTTTHALTNPVSRTKTFIDEPVGQD